MANVIDVVAYIVGRLVYYAQAWSLMWDERFLFPEPIEAWANGPVAQEYLPWGLDMGTS